MPMRRRDAAGRARGGRSPGAPVAVKLSQQAPRALVSESSSPRGRGWRLAMGHGSKRPCRGLLLSWLDSSHKERRCRYTRNTPQAEAPMVALYWPVATAIVCISLTRGSLLTVDITALLRLPMKGEGRSVFRGWRLIWRRGGSVSNRTRVQAKSRAGTPRPE